MNLSKHLEFFNPLDIEEPIHIVGLGAIGSTVAEMLARLGLTNLYFYDFDIVNEHNLANQCFFYDDINKTKLEAIKATCERINPEIDITLKPDGWKPFTKLSGYVFLCVDNIEIRKAIVKENMYNTSIKAMFDFRMGLQDAQHYGADWSDDKSKEAFYSSMDFSHEEAKEATPVSACGTTLSVIPTVRTIVSLGLTNFINFYKENKIKKMIIMDTFEYSIISF